MKTPAWFFGLAMIGFNCLVSAAPTDPLESGFLNPPDSARPNTWWHWMNGNITQAGITADLEAMKQIGLGGATIVNVDCGIPAGDVPFMSPQWREDFKFTIQEANRLGLKLSVENCAGWSSSGGPWITVTNAMQRLTSSETTVSGPTNVDMALPQPPVTLGYYRDIAVLAFKTPVVAADTISGTTTAPAKLEIKRAIYGAEGAGSADVTAKVIALIKSGQKSVTADSSELGGDPAPGSVKQLRVEFSFGGKSGISIANEGDTIIFPANIHQMVKTHTFGKTSVDNTFVHPLPASAVGAGQVVSHSDIINLTAKLSADGHLKWKVPSGSWTILRLGYTPIGVDNHPAPASGTGLECDKFSQAALDAHWNGFMQKVLDDVGPLAGKTLNGSLIDSYEIGNQDWTANFRKEFEKRRGYDPLPFLLTYTRRIVDNPAVTERFLWDMRRTTADLFAENYYDHFAELCRRHGLLSEIEPYTGPFESLQCGAAATVVMGEFWAGSQGEPSVKMAASVAHIYGKNIVGAEAFTGWPGEGGWQNDPFALKPLGDLMFCRGVNLYFFHRYAMQPWTNRWPGMTMGPFGINFERTVTWWNQGKSWISYLTRCEFLLQQGRAVADAAYFDGQSVPVVMRAGNPPLPAGYDYDAVNADVLLHGATVRHGRLTLASGANYAALILPPGDSNMTPQLLKRLRELVRAGATIVGVRPQHSPSLEDFPQCDVQVQKLAGELWGKCDGSNVLENTDGKGHVIWGKSLADVFAAQHLKPDFEFQGDSAATQLAYAHRVAGDTDIYFVSNQRRQFDSAEVTFRVSGKVPELWHPETGVIEPAPVWRSENGRTQVRLNFDPAGSVFVVFRQPVNGVNHVVAVNGSVVDGSSAAPKLEIQHAVYAATDGAGEMDVTAKLSGLISDGQLVVTVNNDELGRDPADLHVKELRVDYTFDGKPGHLTVRENETLTLPPGMNFGQAPQWETGLAANGSPVVKVWSDGQFTLQTAAGKTLQADATDLPLPQKITGAWNLSFPPDWGAPSSVTLGKLISWTDHTNDGVKYFSGTATYEKEIEIPVERLTAGRELWLDLGAVKNFAEVSLNGHDFGVLWKPPFRVNVTAATKPGLNRLKIKVTNLWPNRLIGDEQLPPDCEWNGDQLKAWPQWLLDNKPSPTGRFTFTTWHHYDKDSRLLESGLLGPVKLETAEIIPVK